MVRVAGVDIPDGKRADIALRSLYGVGATSAQKILHSAAIEENPVPKVRELSEEQIERIRQIVDQNYKVEGDLRRQVRQNIQRLIEINCYRGVRHRRGLPLHGQRTRTNARSRKGPKRTVAGRRKSVAKK